MKSSIGIAVLALSSITLSACESSGSGAGVGSTPPPPSYEPVADRMVDDSFVTAGWIARYVDPDGDGIFEYVYSAFDPSADNEAVFSPDGSTLTMNYGGRELDFDLTDPVGAAGETRYAMKDDNGGTIAQVLLIAPEVGGVELSYLNFASVGAMKTDAQGRATGAIDFLAGSVFGSATEVGDLPTSGTATYSTSVIGNGVRAGTNYTFADAATAEFSVDFGNGDISTVLHLMGKDGGGATFDFGTLTGSGRLANGSSYFAGNFGSSVDGRFRGGFFGPEAEEMGYAFFANTPGWEARGFVAGKKD